MHRRQQLFPLAALLLACGGPRREPAPGVRPFTADDERAVRAVDSAYVDAWLRDDTAGVLATLAPDAVLMPAGQHPLMSVAEIRGFWWPQDGSHTKILTFSRQLDEVGGQGDIAWTRGTDTLTFTYGKGAAAPTPQGSRSMTLAVLRRERGGNWRISRMMWATRTR